MIPMITGTVSAVLFWFLLFGLDIVNFWYGMAVASGLLAVWSIIFAGDERKQLFEFNRYHIYWGLISALILYFVFWLGDYFSKLLLEFASGQIDSIYDNKVQLQPWKIGLLLFFWIGPAEEIFWRGMVQRTLAKKFGATYGWILAGFIYAGVHLWAANFVLFMAALICGLFWGWIYKRFDSLWPGIISHAVWDVVIFLILPV